MSIFGDQVIRLLRTKWKSPQELAEELYAMFSADIPLKIEGPVEITTTTQEPPLTIRNYGDSPQDIRIISQNNTTGGIKMKDNNPPQFDPPSSDPGVPTQVLPGRVVSRKQQATYLVDLYGDGPDEDPTERVEVKQLQISQEDEIPADTWVLVLKQTVRDKGSTNPNATKDVYSMQVPVWL